MPDRIDPRLPLTAVLDQAGALITTTAPEDTARPTPCDEFDVGALIGHLIAIPTRIAVIAQGGDAWAVPSSAEVEPDDWAVRWAEACAAVNAALAPDEVLQREFRAPFGPVVEVDESASPFDRLLGWYGREPHPVHAHARA